MIISIEKEKLNKAIQLCLRAVSTRAALPILTGLLLQASEGKLAVSGTDLEMSLWTEVRCDVEESGSTVVSGRLFADVVKNIDGSKIRIATSENFLEIKSEYGAYKLRQMMSEDFPEIPYWEQGPSVKVESAELSLAIQQTARASSSDEKRPVLTGTLMEKESSTGKIRLVTTDSYRLAVKELNASGDFSSWEDCIVPTRMLNEVSRICGQNGGEVELRTQKRQAMFKFEDILVTSRLIEGQFPNYKQLLPKGGKTEVRVLKERMLAALKRAVIFSNNVKLEIGKDRILVVAEAPEVGDSNEIIEAEVSGEDMVIGFNGNYLSDGIGAVQSEKAVMIMSEPQKPASIKMEESEDYIYVIMPVRLRS